MKALKAMRAVNEKLDELIGVLEGQAGTLVDINDMFEKARPLRAKIDANMDRLDEALARLEQQHT